MSGSGGEPFEYLEKFLALIKPLPHELALNFRKVREWDVKANDQMKSIQTASAKHCDAIAAKYKQKQTGAAATASTTTAATGNGRRKSRGPLSPASPNPDSSAAAATTDPNEAAAATGSAAAAAAAAAAASTGSSSFGDLSTYDVDAVERSINNSQTEAIKMAEEKLRIAQASYDQVDSYIRRLDQNLKKFENALRRGGTFEVTAAPVDRRRGKKREFDHAEDHQLYHHLLSELKSEVEKQSVVAVAGSAAAAAAIDPSEPVYCTCKKVSYGEMVACDNPECPTEWFHFACVGLEATPRGKWYCEPCKALRTKKQKQK